MKCPVCKTELSESAKICSCCSFNDLHHEFINAEDANVWFKDIVLPYRQKFKSSQGWQNAIVVEKLSMGFVIYTENGSKGFLPNSQTKSPIEINQSIAVKVHETNNGCLIFTMRKSEEEAWNDIEEKYCTDKWYIGTVEIIVEHGFFIKFEDHVSGLVHTSEIPNYHNESVDKLYSVGEKITARIIHIDTEKRRILLSLKQQEE